MNCPTNQRIKVITVGQQGPPGPPGPSGGGGSSPTIRVVTANTVMTITDYTVEADTTSGNIMITLPSCALSYNATNKTGQIYNIAKPVSANGLTINAAGSDTFNGLATATFFQQANLQIQAGPNNKFTVL